MGGVGSGFAIDAEATITKEESLTACPTSIWLFNQLYGQEGSKLRSRNSATLRFF